MTNDRSPQLARQLTQLGDALERAAEADLAGTPAPRRRIPRKVVLAVAAVVVAVPGLAFAADRLIGNDEVARSLPQGTLALAGTHPSCTVVVQDVEYHCTLTKAPAPEVTDASGVPQWQGTVEPTVDATKHVNGGCRSLRDDGREWECYIGQAAVDQKIVGAGLLGEYAPSPGVG